MPDTHSHQRSASDIEEAIYARDKALKILIAAIITSLLLLAAMALVTYQNFDELYAQQLSVYPRVSAIATLPNVFGFLCLILINVAMIAKVRRTNQILALKGYSLLMSPQFQSRSDEHQGMLNGFLHAAGLPQNYSFERLAKVKTHHFVTSSFPISRAMHGHRAQWIALSRKIDA